MWGGLGLLGQLLLDTGIVLVAVLVLLLGLALLVVIFILLIASWVAVDERRPSVKARRARRIEESDASARERAAAQLATALEIYGMARDELAWIANTPWDDFRHRPAGAVFVAIWPIRLHFYHWSDALGGPKPSSPAALADTLHEFPKYPNWMEAELVDPAGTVVRKYDQPAVLPQGPILPAGTRIRAGSYFSDWTNQYRYVAQSVEVVSGEWAGTRAEFDCGEATKYLIPRLGFVPEDEPLASDPARATALLDRMREVERWSRAMKGPGMA